MRTVALLMALVVTSTAGATNRFVCVPMRVVNAKAVVQQQKVLQNQLALNDLYLQQNLVGSYDSPDQRTLDRLADSVDKLTEIMSGISLSQSGVASTAPTLTQTCTKCHNDANNNGVRLDARFPIDASNALRAMRAIRDGRMPPATEPPLTEEQKALLLGELLDLSN